MRIASLITFFRSDANSQGNWLPNRSLKVLNFPMTPLSRTQYGSVSGMTERSWALPILHVINTITSRQVVELSRLGLIRLSTCRSSGNGCVKSTWFAGLTPTCVIVPDVLPNKNRSGPRTFDCSHRVRWHNPYSSEKAESRDRHAETGPWLEGFTRAFSLSRRSLA